MTHKNAENMPKWVFCLSLKIYKICIESVGIL